jgi:MFS family permease
LAFERDEYMADRKRPSGTPLHNAIFRRLWFALTVSRLGDQFTVLALTWFVLQLTRSGTAIGLVLLCFQLPIMVTGPLVGKLLDRYQFRAVMGLDNLCRAMIMMVFPVLHGLGMLQLWHVYVLAMLAGAVSPGTEVGLSVAIPHLVEGRELEGANALLSMVWEIATLAGPALGGLLVGLFGAPYVILMDALTFLVMGIVAFSLPAERHKKRTKRDQGGGKLLGLDTLFRLKTVRLLTACELFVLFIQGLQSVALAVYSERTLSAGAAEYGLLLSSFGVGSLLGLLFLNRLFARENRSGLVLALILGLFGVMIFPLLFVRKLLAALSFLALAGIFAAPFFPIEQSAVQRLVPARLRGEVFGVRGALGISGYPLGGTAGGILLDHMSAPFVLGMSALACLMGGLAAFLSPAMRGLRREDPVSLRTGE